MADNELIFPPQKGWEPTAPRRTLVPDGTSARRVENWRLGDEWLEVRQMVNPDNDRDFFQPPLATWNPAVGFQEREYPLSIWFDPAANVSSPPLDERPILVMTNWRMLAWSTATNLVLDLSPYIEGAGGNGAVATLGSNTVPFLTGGGGTRPWQNAILEIDGTTIGVVQSIGGGNITLRAPALNNVSGGWKLRWSGEYDGNLNQGYFRVFNNNLYVCRLFQTDESYSVWGLYQVEQIQSIFTRYTFAPAADSEFLWLASNARLHSTEIQNVPGNLLDQPNNFIDADGTNVRVAGAATQVQVRGLDLLQDGRIVVATSSEINPSRIYYSSQIQQPQIHWNQSPGGFTDVVAVAGALQAMGRLGDQLTLHYAHGIAIAIPTGQDDPPLTFQATREIQGCFLWRTLVNVPPATECFVAQDGRLYRFNGSSAEPLGSTQSRIGLESAGFSPDSDWSGDLGPPLDRIFASWDGYNTTLSLWQFDCHVRGTVTGEDTIFVAYAFDLDAWWTGTINFNVTAVSRDAAFFNDAPRYQTDRDTYCLIGEPNHSGVVDDQQYQSSLRFFDETIQLEKLPPWQDLGNDPPFPCVLEFDPISAGDKTVTVDYVALELAKRETIAGAGTSRVTVSVTYFDGDGAGTVVTLVDQQDLTVAINEGITRYFQGFDSNSGEKAVVRIEVEPSVSRFLGLRMGMVRIGVNVLGEIRSEGRQVG